MNSGSTLKRSLLHLVQIKKNILFFVQFNFVSKKEMFLSVVISTAVVLTEAMGLALAYPILTFIETSGSVDSFVNSSKINEAVFYFLQFFGLPLTLAVLMIVAFVLISCRQVINYFSIVYLEAIKWNTGKRIGERLASVFFHANAEYAGSIKSGELTVLLDFECQAVSSILVTYLAIWQTTIAFLMYFVIITVVAPIPAILLTIFLVWISFLLRHFIRRTYYLGQQSVDARASLFNFVAERHSAWKTIKLLNSMSIELEKFSKLAGTLVDLRLGIAKLSGRMGLIFVPMAVGTLFIVLFVLIEVVEVEISVLMMFGIIMLRLVPVAQSYQKKIAQLARFEPSMIKIKDFLTNSCMLQEGVNDGVGFKKIHDGIQFKNVTFKFPDRDANVLSDVSFNISSGRLTGIIGASGSGKTTILDIISGLKKINAGEVFFDKVPISKIKLTSLRSEIALLTQEPFLFDDTVRNNLRYALTDVSENDLQHALHLSNSLHFINSLPQGLNTRIGDRGSSLSVGQKQRLSIARALLTKASIFLLDEPTSSLDQDSESLIVEMIDMLIKEKKTVVVVAHRLQTLARAHHVIQIEEGKIIKQGSFQNVVPANVSL